MKRIVVSNQPRKPEEILAAFAALIAPYLREALSSDRPARDERFDLTQSPAGKRRAYADARAGHIKGAERIGRRWFCSEQAHAEWIDSIAVKPTVVTTDTTEASNNLDALRERLGLRLVGGDRK
jgi:hypothetical protein